MMIKIVADTAKRKAKAWSKWSPLLDPSSSHQRANAAASYPPSLRTSWTEPFLIRRASLTFPFRYEVEMDWERFSSWLGNKPLGVVKMLHHLKVILHTFHLSRFLKNMSSTIFQPEAAQQLGQQRDVHQHLQLWWQWGRRRCRRWWRRCRGRSVRWSHQTTCLCCWPSSLNDGSGSTEFFLSIDYFNQDL